MAQRAEITLIKQGLCIGNAPAAYHQATLEREGITHIICAAADLECMFPDEYVYKFFEIEDHPNYNILQHVEESNEFIDSARTLGGKVLVH
jgi:hypothetical protein